MLRYAAPALLALALAAPHASADPACGSARVETVATGETDLGTHCVPTPFRTQCGLRHAGFGVLAGVTVTYCLPA